MGEKSILEMSFQHPEEFSSTKWMFFALFTVDRTPSAKGIKRGALVFARDVVSERRLYGSGGIPEPYSGRPLHNPSENPALRIKRLWRVSFVNKRPLAVN